MSQTGNVWQGRLGSNQGHPASEAGVLPLNYAPIACTAHKLELDLSGLLRGDPAQRWQSWAIAVQHGILSPDEVREEEGWNPGAPKPAPGSFT
jgi:hypothetical protein